MTNVFRDPKPSRSVPSSALSAVSRRRFLVGSATASAAIAMPFVRARASEPLYVNTWGGVWQENAQKHLFDPFTEATGIEIRTITPVSYAKLVAQAKTGTYDFDVTSLGGNQVVQANAENLLEPLNLDIIDATALPEKNLFDNSVASHCFSTNLVYNKEVYPDGMASWKDFWDLDRFPGKRSLNRSANENLSIALLADGVDPKQLYPLDADRAFHSLDKIKAAIPSWWEAGPQSLQLIRDGEVQASGMWHSITFAAMDAGAPLQLIWNQARINRAYWAVSKGTPRSEQAWRFVAFATSPERNAAFCQAANYGPLNPKAFEHLTEQVSVRMPTYPDNYKLCVEEDETSVGLQMTELTRRFNDWITA